MYILHEKENKISRICVKCVLKCRNVKENIIYGNFGICHGQKSKTCVRNAAVLLRYDTIRASVSHMELLWTEQLSVCRRK